MNLIRSLKGCTAVLLAAASVIAAGTAQADSLRAEAKISGCTDPGIRGILKLKEKASAEGVKEVEVKLRIEGLSPGAHGVHIHERATCEPCGAAGGHFDPGPVGLPSPDGNHPFHSGDLVNVVAKSNGSGRMKHTTSRITLSPGPLSIFDADGSAVIVHVDPDTYCPDGVVAGCAGGARAACGIIERVDADADDEDDDRD